MGILVGVIKAIIGGVLSLIFLVAALLASGYILAVLVFASQMLIIDVLNIPGLSGLSILYGSLIVMLIVFLGTYIGIRIRNKRIIALLSKEE